MARLVRHEKGSRLAGRRPRRQALLAAGRVALGVAVGSVAGSVGWPSVARGASSVTVAYSRTGLSCEGALFAAQARGYFRDEGLELVTLVVPGSPEAAVEMMKGNADAMQDPAWTLVAPLLPSGMKVGDMIATAGLQRGSMSIVVPASSAVRGLVDLRGQKVSAAPRWRFMFAQPIGAAGLDPRKDIDWQAALPPGQVAAALKSGEVAAAAVHQPYAAAIELSGDGRILIAQNSPPQQNDYCCAVVLPGTLVRSDRPKAAAITRALMRGSAWARSQPGALAQLEVDVKHVTQSLAANQRAVATLDFFPSVEVTRQNTLDIVQRFKRFGFLDPATDERQLLEQIFVPVTGEIATFPVVQLPTGLPRTGAIGLAELAVPAGAAVALAGALLRRRRG